jgi:hypothetical protein
VSGLRTGFDTWFLQPETGGSEDGTPDTHPEDGQSRPGAGLGAEYRIGERVPEQCVRVEHEPQGANPGKPSRYSSSWLPP